jgi:PAS domain S-box-containing protein
MLIAPVPANEAERLARLHSLAVLDTPADPTLDAITGAAAAQFGCPMALVSLIDEDRQWFKSRQGLDVPQTPREQAFCAHAILDDRVFTVSDARTDERFADNPLVTGDPHIRFYAGHPLMVDGQAVGTLCVLDREPHELTDDQAQALAHLARAAEACLSREWRQRQLAEHEALLRERDARLRHISQHLPGVIFQYELLRDGSSRFPFASEGLREACGLSAEEVATDAAAFFARLHAEDLDAVSDSIAYSARTLTPWHQEFRVVLPRRGVRWLEWQATPERRDNGHVLWNGFITDVTARRRTEAALAETQRRLQLAMRILQLGILHIDTEAGLVDLDRRACDDHGLDGAEPQRPLWRWMDRLGTPDRELLEGAMSQALSRQGPVRVVYEVRRPNGALGRVELHMERLDARGRLMAVCRDVTQAERAEQALRDAGLVEQRRRDQGDFLARVSHELRTPMTAILGFAQLLGEDEGTRLLPHQKRWLEQIRSGGQHLLALVDDVLDLSRLCAGHHGLRLAPVALDRVLRDCNEFLMPLAADNSVDIEFAPSSSGARITADAGAVRQVLVNVLGNAIKFNRRGGTVTTRVIAEETQCVAEVWDDGPGIPADRLAQVFMPFERAGAEDGSVRGTGLGLSIAKELVQAMGGTIEAIRPPGGGTCIRIALPRACDEAEGGAAAREVPLSVHAT